MFGSNTLEYVVLVVPVLVIVTMHKNLLFVHREQQKGKSYGIRTEPKD
jgi:hypothetical protein